MLEDYDWYCYVDYRLKDMEHDYNVIWLLMTYGEWLWFIYIYIYIYMIMWVTPILCAYVCYNCAMYERHEFLWCLHLCYMHEMLLGTCIYVWCVTWSHMMVLHDYEVQKYDYEKWWNEMYMWNGENAKHVKR